MIEKELWFDRKTNKPSFSESEKPLIEKEKPFAIKSYGSINQDTLEASIIGHMIADFRLDGQEQNKSKFEKILSFGVKDYWFERKDLASLFNDLCLFYKEYRRVPYVDESGELCLNKGQTPSEASAYKHAVRVCRGTQHAQRIGLDLLLQRFWAHYSQKTNKKAIQEYERECDNPNIGPIIASENLSEKVKKNINVAKDSEIKVSDLIDDYEENISWLDDLKENPDKYKGYMCGLKAIDSKTQGLRKGQLTVIVGSHGGFKTTLMMNIAWGCYLSGCNVMYVSLEMEKNIVETKLWCRATGTVSYSRLYNGGRTTPEDWDRIDQLAEELKNPNLDKEERKRKQIKHDMLKFNLKTINKGEGKEDSVLISKMKAQLESNKNKFKTLTASQLQKLRPSQIDAWLEEKMGEFKPDIIFFDYLGLMGADHPNPGRPDLDYGEICQHLRQMGKNRNFAIVTAAQLSRQAVKKIHDAGENGAGKANLGTGDVADSHKIGGDADNMFVLWKEPSGNAVRIFTVKARYGALDTTNGEVVQVDHETCTISDNVRDTSIKTAEANIFDANRAVHKINTGGNGIGMTTDLTNDANDDVFYNPHAEQPLDGDGTILDPELNTNTVSLDELDI